MRRKEQWKECRTYSVFDRTGDLEQSTLMIEYDSNVSIAGLVGDLASKLPGDIQIVPDGNVYYLKSDVFESNVSVTPRKFGILVHVNIDHNESLDSYKFLKDYARMQLTKD